MTEKQPRIDLYFLTIARNYEKFLDKNTQFFKKTIDIQKINCYTN